MKFLAIAIFFLLFVTQVVLAQDEIPPSEEVWPELNAFYSFNSKYRLFTMISGTKVEKSYYSDGAFGIHLDYFKPYQAKRALGKYDSLKNRLLRVRVGYMYGTTPPSAEDPFKEHTLLTETIHAFPLSYQLLITAKNRIDWRIRDGEFLPRYRPRLTIERDCKTHYLTFNAYLYGEYFLNFGKPNINRWRLCGGAEIRVSRNLNFEWYYLYQFKNSPDVGKVNAIGLVLKAYFHAVNKKNK
ncbi:DUF2490 domain-containing protein [Solitalea canadensis]|nr:DUF2490 domain-containing protein [Solitalea canadensis]